MVEDTDFTGKTVLVVGGSSGIGNGIAHGFKARGADVHVWGTRVSASDYSAEDGSDLSGLTYTQVDVGDPDQIDNPYVDSASNGLTIVAERFRTEKIGAHVTLVKGERSELASLAADRL
mgnify:CR=1 FL=1